MPEITVLRDWLARARAVWRPAMYHGHGMQRDFFEGWYYKFVDAAEQRAMAVIPGVFLGRDPGRSHCFVQVLDGETGRSTYHPYPLAEFSASRRALELRVGPNRFTDGAITLDIAGPERRLRGQLRFAGLRPWPVSLASPGIMGWYAYVPFMECYHGVLSLDHAVDGALELDGRLADFAGGRGYIEKDWGRAFPDAWLWAQTNHFEQPGVCLTASVATIPWLGTAFRGFIIGLLHGGRLTRFATYTGARIDELRLTDTRALLRVSDRRHRLRIEAERAEGGLLHAPYRTEMLQRVTESLTAAVRVRLAEAGGRVVFDGVGRHAGLEINGQLRQIFDAGAGEHP
jgi:hypothetical protein